MKNSAKLKWALGGAAAVGAVASVPTFPYWTHDTVTITVKDKDRITQGSGQNIHSKYLIFTTHTNGKEETFQNTDSWLYFKFNSSDLQGKLNIGKTFECSAYGWRIPLMSKYRNLISCEPAPTAK